MDKELIKMCDCPEIQDRWEPKDGDRFYNTHFKGHWMLPDREACEGGDECECCNWEEHEVKESKYIIYIPRIEDVLEWLVPKYWEGWNHAINAMLEYRFTDDAPARIWYDHLKSWIAFYMHLEHNKTWDGETWA